MPSTVLLAEKLLSFAGLELSAVCFEWDTVQIRFVGEYNVSVRVHKAFQLQLPSDSVSLEVVPGGGGNSQAAGELASLVKARLLAITYSPNKLAIFLAGGQNLLVPLSTEDFDPVEISCAHHVSPNELEWFSVVNAAMARGEA